MISAGSAVSDSSTAPSTDCSASRFCGGVTGPSKPREWPLAGLCRGRSSGPTESRSGSGGDGRRRAISPLAAGNRCDPSQIVTSELRREGTSSVRSSWLPSGSGAS